MTVHDMTTQRFRNVPAPVPVGGHKIIKRRFLGSDLTGAINGVTPANGDTYKIMQIGKHQLVTRAWTIVSDADDTSITLAIGHTDGVTTTNNSLEASAALNSQGVIETADDKIFFGIPGFITITPSTLSGMDSDLEFVVAVEVVDLYDAGVAEALTTTI